MGLHVHGQFSKRLTNCGYGPKGRLGVIVEVWNQIKSMSLAIYTMICWLDQYSAEQLTKPRKVWEGIKELKVPPDILQGQRMHQIPCHLQKLRMVGSFENDKVQALLPSCF